MQTQLFKAHADAIRETDFSTITSAAAIPSAFRLGSEGDLVAQYIPFDYVNEKAKVVIVGITPGFTQWKNALVEARLQLCAGASADEARRAARRTGAFSGPMRPNLVNLLDRIGIQRWLGIDSCDTLFSRHADLVQMTSILRHPVFLDNTNYNGTPSIVKTPFLKRLMLDHFAAEAKQLPEAIYIPLGPKVSDGLRWLAEEGVLKWDRVLSGLPHPSGANAERIAYFLGNKKMEALSSKTNAIQLDEARRSLIDKIVALS